MVCDGRRSRGKGNRDTVIHVLCSLMSRVVTTTLLVSSAHSTWNSIRWQFAGGQHYIPEVERAVVDATQLNVGVAGHKVAERGGDPAQRGEVASSQHVDVGLLRQFFIQI